MNTLRFPILAALLLLGMAKLSADPISPDTIGAWSAPWRGWHYYPELVIPAAPDIPGHAGIEKTDVPTAFQLPDDPRWFMSFIGFDGRGYQSYIAESTDLVHWTQPRLAMGFGEAGSFDHGGVVLGAYLYERYGTNDRRTLKKHDGKYWSLYGAYPRQGGYELRPGYEGVAVSDDGLSWRRAVDRPILSIFQDDAGAWEKDCIYQPWLVEYEGRFYNVYNAAEGGVEQSGVAFSENLLDWRRHPKNPVIPVGPKGSFNEVFSSDPKVYRDGDHWIMIFFGVGQGHAHIMAAFSRDLLAWTVDPEPLYRAGAHPGGLDTEHAHKVSLVYNPANDTRYLFYNAVGTAGRGIGLLTSKPLAMP